MDDDLELAYRGDASAVSRLIARVLNGNEDAVDVLIKYLDRKSDSKAVDALVKYTLNISSKGQAGEWVIQHALNEDRKVVSALIAGLSKLIAWVLQRKAAILNVASPKADAVEDFTQDVAMALLVGKSAALRRYDSERARLTTYVCRIAYHKAHDLLAKEIKRPVVEEIDDGPDEAPADTIHERLLHLHAYKELLATLSNENLEIFRLLFLEELEPRVVAQRMKMSVQNIYNRKSIIRKAAREILNRLEQSKG